MFQESGFAEASVAAYKYVKPGKFDELFRLFLVRGSQVGERKWFGEGLMALKCNFDVFFVHFYLLVGHLIVC